MDIHHLGISKAFDMKEWISAFLGVNFVKAEILDHLKGLKGKCPFERSTSPLFIYLASSQSGSKGIKACTTVCSPPPCQLHVQS